MSDRRRFLKLGIFGALGTGAWMSGARALGANAGIGPARSGQARPSGTRDPGRPVVLSTWYHGLPANNTAVETLSGGGSALDAVEAGVRVPEADPASSSVGYGGLPDRDGRVTLDACIMGADGSCGSVSYLEHIKHPISVARQVMEKTPHVMLSGEGALRFALDNGFPKEDLLTDKARQRWVEWLADSGYDPVGEENHDTIGLLVRTAQGELAGACTTSGLAWKMHGRVGDSPIIGAGLYVDGDVGAATATGVGEMVIKSCGSFLIVELMRQGASPGEACEEAVRRIVGKQVLSDARFGDKQVGYLALDKDGRVGAHAIRRGFSYALHADGDNAMHEAAFMVD